MYCAERKWQLEFAHIMNIIPRAINCHNQLKPQEHEN